MVNKVASLFHMRSHGFSSFQLPHCSISRQVVGVWRIDGFSSFPRAPRLPQQKREKISMDDIMSFLPVLESSLLLFGPWPYLILPLKKSFDRVK